MKRMIITISLMFLLYTSAAAYEIIKPPEIKISGYSQLGYIRDNSTTAAPANNYGFEDNFKVFKARFNFKGNIDPKVSMNVQIDAAAKYVSNNIINILTDAYFDAGYLKGHTIRFGQFKLPFGLENPISDAKLYAINTAIVKGKCINTRDIGIDISAKNEMYEYHLGLVNGTGANKSDDNSGKDVYASLSGMVSSRLRIGGSVLSSGGSTNVSTLKHAYGAFIQATPSWGEIDIEAIKGTDKNSKDRQGWYVMVLPQLNPRTWLVTRYEKYDPNKSVSSDEATKTTLGILYQASKYTKFKLNYEWRDDKNVANEGNAFLFIWQVEY